MIYRINKFIPAAMAVLLLGSPAVMAAGDQQVNCRMETTEIPVYSGWAHCSVGGKTLSEYFGHSYNASVTIRDTQDFTKYCSATLNQTSTESRTKNICDYTPMATVSAMPAKQIASGSPYIAEVKSFFSDRDGTIVRKELSVDGVVVRTGNGSASLTHSIAYYSKPAKGTWMHVSVVATDDDGYTTTETGRFDVGAK